MFTPKLFISVGATGAMFTLRETYQHIFYISGKPYYETRSFHHQNLANNPDDAFNKATELAKVHGYELKTTRESLEEELREIRRSTKEEIEQRRIAAEQWQKEQEQQRLEILQEKKDLLRAGIFTFGPHRDQKFEEAAPSYLDWLASKINDFADDSLPKIAAATIISKFSHLLPPRSNNEWYGIVGEKYEGNVTVVRATGFYRASFSGYGEEYIPVITMVSEDGYTFVVMSIAFTAQEGAKLHIKGTIKKHSEYKGEAQTFLQRVKIIA